MSELSASLSALFGYFRSLMACDVVEYATDKRQLALPRLPMPLLIDMLGEAKRIFEEEPNVLRVTSPVVIVGDLHGQLLDLFRILQRHGFPPTTKYLFLGDFVDRGQFSLETIVLVIVMKCLWPSNITIIRGNHEFEGMYQNGGFGVELNACYNNPIINKMFTAMFSFIPYAAVVDGRALCVHGGIGPSFKSLKDLEGVKRPITDFSIGSVSNAFWSDPNEFVEMYQWSTRGTGFLFGPKALRQFLNNEGLEILIRGHQCVRDGVEFQLQKMCATVFSASTYCGLTDNKGGVLIYNNGQMEVSVFDQIPVLERKNCQFVESATASKWMLELKTQNVALPKLITGSDEVKGITPNPSGSGLVLVESRTEQTLTGRLVRTRRLSFRTATNWRAMTSRTPSNAQLLTKPS